LGIELGKDDDEEDEEQEGTPEGFVRGYGD